MTKKEIEVKVTKVQKQIANKTVAKETVKKQLPKAIVSKKVRTSEQEQLLNKEKDICVKYSKVIRAEMSKTEESFVKIAHSLYMIHRSNAYKSMGCNNIYDFAKQNFGIARGTTSDFINVIEQFAKRDESKNVLCEIEDKYKEFSSTKLTTIIGMTKEDLEKVNSSMTVKELKAIKKEEKKADNSSKKSSKNMEDKDSDILTESNPTVSNVVISFNTLEEYNKNIDKLDALILRCLKVGHKVTVSEQTIK